MPRYDFQFQKGLSLQEFMARYRAALTKEDYALVQNLAQGVNLRLFRGAFSGLEETMEQAHLQPRGRARVCQMG